VQHSTISNNSSSGDGISQGGGIDNEGKLTVSNSILSGNKAVSTNGISFGGGIDNYKTGILTVTSSTISNNTASSTSNNGQGGGIYNHGKLTVVNSTIFGNEATSDQGTTFGGGIYNYKTGILTVTSSTISNNTASSTSNNGQGGGIDNDGTLTLSTSIIAANNAQQGPDVLGSLISGGYNLLTNIDSVNGLNSTDKHVTLDDLKLDPTLGNNGGSTQTLKLLPGSVAIDAVPQQACSITITDPVSGKTMTITTDQRGNPRPDASENTCDIGAFESAY
jgi:hypothetical protein